MKKKKISWQKHNKRQSSTSKLSLNRVEIFIEDTQAEINEVTKKNFRFP